LGVFSIIMFSDLLRVNEVPCFAGHID